MALTGARPARRRAPPVWIWLVVVLVLAGGGVAWWRSRSAAETATAAASTAQTATATRGDLRVSVSGPGTLAPVQTRALTARVSGTVTALPNVGDRVAQGRLLARLDPRDAARAVENARLSLQKAEAALATLRANQTGDRASSGQSVEAAALNVQTAERALADANRILASNEGLFAIGGLSRADLETSRSAAQKARADLDNARLSLATARAQSGAKTGSNAEDERSAKLAVDQARLSLATAEDDLAATKVYAPFDGVVSEVPATVGASVQPGGALLTVIDDSAMTLPVQVDETEIARVKVGQPADVTLDALEGQTFRGEVTRVSPAARQEQNISIFDVTVALPNDTGALRAGMTAEADIVSEEVRNTVLVPRRAVETVRNRAYVRVQRGEGEPERVRVRTGPDDGTNVAVTSGLEGGETLVLPTRERATTTNTTRAPGGFGLGLGVPRGGGR